MLYLFLVFQYHMQRFTTFIVNLMKKDKLFASQGGPIILAQARHTLFYLNCQNFSSFLYFKMKNPAMFPLGK